jgi:hypothetical protein
VPVTRLQLIPGSEASVDQLAPIAAVRRSGYNMRRGLSSPNALKHTDVGLLTCTEQYFAARHTAMPQVGHRALREETGYRSSTSLSLNLRLGS